MLTCYTENGTKGKFKVVGEYGCHDLPIVLVDGEEFVAQPYYCSLSGKPICPVCQSRGCDYCDCDFIEGCRYGMHSEKEIRYII